MTVASLQLLAVQMALSSSPRLATLILERPLADFLQASGIRFTMVAVSAKITV
jgi:hypothetical protein